MTENGITHKDKKNVPRVPYLLTCFTCSLPYVLACLCAFASYVPSLMPYVPSFFYVLYVPSLFYVPYVSSFFCVPYVPSFFYVLYVSSFFTWLSCLHFLRALRVFIFYLNYIPSVFYVAYMTSFLYVPYVPSLFKGFQIFNMFYVPLPFFIKCGATQNQLQQAGTSKNKAE